GGGDNGATSDAGPEVSIDDFVHALPASCAFDCKNGCPDEKIGPFVCPAMQAWGAIPHADECGNAEPKPPAPTTGQCTATEPSGEALRKAGAGSLPDEHVLPDGHRILPAGGEAILVDGTHIGGFPVSIAPIPSTHYAIVVEAGFGDH